MCAEIITSKAMDLNWDPYLKTIVEKDLIQDLQGVPVLNLRSNIYIIQEVTWST